MKNIIIKMLLLALGLILSIGGSFAQDAECGAVVTEEIARKTIKSVKNRKTQKHYSSIEAVSVQPYIIKKSDGSYPGISETQVNSMETQLDGLFGPTNISFNFCPIKIIKNDDYFNMKKGNYSKISEMTQLHFEANKVNIYFLENVHTSWAKFPTEAKQYIIMKNDHVGNESTMTHEMGHYFGLFHTHEKINGHESVARSGCTSCLTTGDLLCDTPADPHPDLLPLVDPSNPDTTHKTLGHYVTGCNFDGMPITDGCGLTYSPDPSNIMSYSHKICRTTFSDDQIAAMVFVRQNNLSYLTSDCSISLGNCFDNVQNGTETEIDCGGTCPPCHCFDDIPNQGEIGTDCGGTCPFACTNNGPVIFDCEAGCYNNLTLVCSAVSAEEYNGSIVVSNAQITNNGSTTAYNVQIGFALVGSTGEIPLQVWVPSSDIIAEIAPNETVTIAPLLNTPDNLDGAYEVRVKIVGTDNSCLSTESLYFGTPPSGESCYDGIQNQGEAGIDCGYPCPPCTINTCDYTITNYTDCQVRIYWKDNQDNNWYGEIIPPYGSTTETVEDGYIWLAYNNATNALITTYFDVVDCSSPNGIIPADDCSGGLIATCSDGIRNQLETDIDCGGPCPACPTCSDGIQNQGETYIDCGGPCPPCDDANSDCTPAWNLSEVNLGGIYEAQYTVTSTATISPNLTAVIFKAGNYVSLEPGFSADGSNGYYFQAEIDDCDGGWKIENEQAPVSLRNYPNPFTGHTTIEFVLSKDSPVTLFVSDMTGRKVAMLLNNETQTQGTHLLTFDGRDYPGGMYYYTIQAGEYLGTQKMILVK